MKAVYESNCLFLFSKPVSHAAEKDHGPLYGILLINRALYLPLKPMGGTDARAFPTLTGPSPNTLKSVGQQVRPFA